MRQSDHAKGLISFTIDADGLSFGHTVDDVSGLLGWSALRGGTDA
jgi:hypothetical protein